MREFPKPPQRLTPPFEFTNSNFAIERFPFPFDHLISSDSVQPFQYSANIEAHNRGVVGSVTEHYFDIDEHYFTEIHERARVLDKQKSHCLVLAHMKNAEWEWFFHTAQKLSKDYPNYFELHMRGNEKGVWRNHLMGIEQHFAVGSDLLPEGPMAFLGRQIQGDFVLLDQRGDHLYLDAGIVTGPSDWSLAFDIGMDFMQWHKPVPDAQQVFERAQNYLLTLQPGNPVRRLNWILSVNPRLDRSLESYPEWHLDKTNLTSEKIGTDVYFRVELQVLERLPKTRAIMFSIRTYLLSMNDLVKNKERSQAFYQVIKTLPESISDYKGISPFRVALLTWMEEKIPELKV